MVSGGQNFVRVLLEELVLGLPFDSVSAAASLVPATFDSALGHHQRVLKTQNEAAVVLTFAFLENFGWE